MLSPTPLSLLCALLLCLPMAIVFTINSPGPTARTAAVAGKDTHANPEAVLAPEIHRTAKNRQNFEINTLASPRPPVDDESLLRVASRVNSKAPPGSPKKLAFMFLTTTPLPFAPLWEIYFNQTPRQLFNIYIHAHPSYDYDPPFTGVFAHRVILSKPAFRYTPTLSSAARRLLAHALLHDRSNAMFALLSPSCIPIHSFNFTYQTLIPSAKSFIEILKDEPGTYDRWAARGPEAMLPEVKLEDFRIGSQFWVLTRRHAKLVVRDRRLWAKFKQPCVEQNSCYPEENYFPTLLHLRDPQGSVAATLTHVDWSVSEDGHPRMYAASEVEMDLIFKLRSARPRYGDDGTNGSDAFVTERYDPFLFARKFSPEAIQPLLSMAKDVLFKD